MRGCCLLPVVLLLAAVSSAQSERPRLYTDVPYVVTPEATVEAMLQAAGIKPGDTLVDLGSGNGTVVLTAAKKYGIHSTGVEIDPELVRQSRQSAEQAGVADTTAFVNADIFGYDLRAATVVTLYLTPGVNLRLRSKLLDELRPGARVVSHRFDMGNWKPDRTIEIGTDRIYLWVIPDGKPVIPQTGQAAGQPPFDALAASFAYNRGEPLDLRVDARENAGGAAILTISYAGARGRVSAALVTPLAPGKHPAIVYVHDSGKKRDEFLAEAVLLAETRLPAVSLLIDSPIARPVGWRRNFNGTIDGNDRDIHIQAVIDIRRGIDLLASREDVDAARLAFVGHGQGANWGAILSGIEPRLRALVLVAGVPSLTELMNGDDPDAADMRYVLGDERFARYVASLAVADPIRFTSHSIPERVLFQFGRFDPYVAHTAADRLARSLPRPPQVAWYDAGHDVNAPGALRDRWVFLAHELNLAAPRTLD